MKSIALCIGCHWIHLFSIFCKEKFYQKAKWSTIADLVLPHEIGLWPTASWRIVHKEAFALLYGHQFKLLHTTFDNHYNDILMYLIQFKIIQVYSTSVLFSDTKHLSTRHTGERSGGFYTWSQPLGPTCWAVAAIESILMVSTFFWKAAISKDQSTSRGDARSIDGFFPWKNQSRHSQSCVDLPSAWPFWEVKRKCVQINGLMNHAFVSNWIFLTFVRTESLGKRLCKEV